MPNWCMTDITFCTNRNITNPDLYKEAKRRLSQLYSMITRQADGENHYYNLEKGTMETSALENGFGDSWLGNYLIIHNIVSKETLDTKRTIRCRGSIIYIDDDYDEFEDDSFYIHQEDAWAPNLYMWVAILNSYYNRDFPYIQVFYQCEEPGMCIYNTNDIERLYYPSTHVVDLCLLNRPQFPMIQDNVSFRSYYPESENELVNFIKTDITGDLWLHNTLSQYCNYIYNVLDRYPKSSLSPFIPVDHETGEDIIRYEETEFFNVYPYEFCSIEDMDPCYYNIRNELIQEIKMKE